ncbi:MAG: helix-turn-helix transcriptional regulator [Flavobacteriaceae bacterium]
MELKPNPLEDTPISERLPLSQIELEILTLIKEGYISKEIAGIRNCSSRTVEKHRSNIIKKLGIESSQHALLLWIVQNPQHFDN